MYLEDLPYEIHERMHKDYRRLSKITSAMAASFGMNAVAYGSPDRQLVRFKYYNGGRRFLVGVFAGYSAGYGDFYHVTLEGRLVAAVLMIAGVALFTTLTAYIVLLFFP